MKKLKNLDDKSLDFIYFDPEYAQDMKTGEFIHLETGKRVRLSICLKSDYRKD